jgi:hypothetical protein
MSFMECAGSTALCFERGSHKKVSGVRLRKKRMEEEGDLHRHSKYPVEQKMFMECAAEAALCSWTRFEPRTSKDFLRTKGWRYTDADVG